MERMHALPRIDRSRRGDHRLRDHLSAKDPLAHRLGEGGEGKFVWLFSDVEVEELGYAADDALPVDRGVDSARAIGASLNL
ncbi:hypothetical protein GCM10009115_32630 [Sphingopyxis soli]|uniref:Uncharacterized protein n=1 Tax=Sphingopyxis soli TaxID=592051 RepID=A0ABP3XMX3_9SPHN